MPLGPMKALEFAHNAIQVTTAEIEEVVLAATDPQVAVALRERVTFLADFIHVHVAGEEHALYPALAAKVPHIEKAFLWDHRDEEQLYADLHGVVARCAEAGTGERLAALRRQVTVLRALSDSHVKKENQVVLPLLGECFDLAEQAAMLQGILSVIPPAQMPRYLPWIVACQPDEQAVAYVSVLQKSMPPPAFAAAKGWIRGGVPAARWSLLAASLPGLES